MTCKNCDKTTYLTLQESKTMKDQEVDYLLDSIRKNLVELECVEPHMRSYRYWKSCLEFLAESLDKDTRQAKRWALTSLESDSGFTGCQL